MPMVVGIIVFALNSVFYMNYNMWLSKSNDDGYIEIPVKQKYVPLKHTHVSNVVNYNIVLNVMEEDKLGRERDIFW